MLTAGAQHGARRIGALGGAFLLAVAVLTGIPLVTDAQPALAQACVPGTTGVPITWGSSGTGFVWQNNAANSVSGASNTYALGSTGQNMTVSYVDLDARNADTNAPLDGPLGNTFKTQTDGIYGAPYLTLVNTSLTSDEVVAWSFAFDKPVLVENLQISDIDWHGFRRAQQPAPSFEDELTVLAIRGPNTVNYTATPGADVLQTGNVFLANRNGGYNSPYPNSNNTGGRNPGDPEGRITINSNQPVTEITFDYSNGPNDAIQDALDPNGQPNPPIPPNSPGVSDSHAIAINNFTVCVGNRTIGDTVWADVDNDGLIDTNEPLLAGVPVELVDTNGAVIETTTTDASGNYTFTQLIPFDWTVRVTPPAGYSAGFDRDGGADGTATVPEADLAAGNVADADFGLVPDPGTVSGRVFEDYNNDGTFDSGQGEIGIAGVSLSLIGTDLGGSPINLTTTTAADGQYTFTGVPAGTYTVTETQPAGYLDGIDTAGTGNTVLSNDNILVDLDILESSGGNNFAEIPDSELTGSVFEDTNNNGVQDGAETGIGGVTMTLTNESTNATLTTTTAADGTYSFTGFGPGTYTVAETQPAGFLDGIDTAGDRGGDAASVNDQVSGVVLGPNEDAAGYNFAEIPGTSIAGSVIDEDGDPIAGVTVTLTGTNDLGALTPLTTTTAADGSYSFADLRPGTYTVTETQPATHGDGGETAGTSGGTVADDQISGIVLNAGDVSTGNDFDEITGSIAGSVVDEAGNPIAGVTVTLTGTEATPSGAAVNRTAVTAADGTYLFDDVLGGTYTLTETQPAGYADGTETAGTAGGSIDNTPGADAITGIALAGGQDATGYVHTELLSSISGRVFLDEDNSGTQDLPGDNGIAGVTVTLTDGGGGTQTTTTDANGDYSFTQLPAGTYTVTETQPGNYVDGTDTVGSAGGTLGPDSVSGIVVNGGAATGYNFAELPSAGISGIVVDDDGDPIAGVDVTLTGTDDLGNSVSQTFTTAADGQFVFFGLRGGTYAIAETQPLGYGDGPDTNGSIPGTAANDNFTNIVLGPDDVSNGFVFSETRGSIAGLVQDSAGNPISGVDVTLTGTDDRGNTINSTIQTAADGTYSFVDLFSGTYQLNEAQPAGYQDGPETAGTAGGDDTSVNDQISGINLSAGQDATGYIFNEQLGALSGSVYEDLNANGVQDPGEPGIPGVTVTLSGTDLGGSAITPRTDVTDAFGEFTFPNLEGGTYTLTETQPAAFIDGQDRAGLAGGTVGTAAGDDSISAITLPLGQSSQGYTFGEVEPNSISGTVFLDPNNDGVQQGAEVGIDAVVVTLTGTDDFGQAVSVAGSTQPDGTYTFTGLRPGDYTVTETQPTGNVDGLDTVGTAGGSSAVNDQLSGIALTSNENATGYDFAELEGASIAGSVLDEDGAPIAGVRIDYSGTDDLGAAVSGFVLTAADGTYVVGSLRPGTYTVTETQPAAYGDGGQTAGTNGGDDTTVNDQISGIVLASGEDTTGYDFDETLGSISGVVYNDLNGNGVRDGGEPGLAGVDVQFNDGGTIRTETTNATGGYTFDSVVANGPVTISQPTQPAGFLDGSETVGDAATAAGTLPGVDDDSIGAIEISGGQDATGYNFGEIESASIAGTVVADADNDGVADGGETGIAGVTLTLTGTDGLGRAVSATTTTNASGDYLFGNLYPGTYTVTETQPAAFFDGNESVGTNGGTNSANDVLSDIVVSSGDNATDYDFGELEAASISGQVLDTLGNPIPGVTLTLAGPGGPATTTTDAAGQYTFGGLVPGTYTVTETQPANYGDGGESAGSAGGDDSVDDTISNITLAPAENATGYDFTETLGSISGLVYEDLNANGAFDAGEPGIDGVDVTLTDGGGASTTLQTSGGGTFTFDDLVGGSFTLTETQPAGYADGDDASGTAGGTAGNDVVSGISLGGGQDAVDYRFGEVRESSIAGSVEDENGAGIGGVLISFSGTDYRGLAVSGSVLTQADGSYIIANLRPGTYTVTETQPAQYGDGSVTAGSAGGDDSVPNTISAIALGSNVTATGYDFVETFGSIAGVVFDDQNANGVQDAGEPGLAGVGVQLTGGSSPVVVTTAADGSYLFDDLLAATYTVSEPTQPAGFLDGRETAGSAGGSVGGVAGSDAISGINLAGGVDSVGNDFAEVAPSSLAGTVVIDDDNDGVADGGEAGIPGVTITLTGTDDFGTAVSETATTDGSGDFDFADVRPGTYTLTESQPVANLDGLETAGTAGGTVSANDTISGIALTPGTSGTDYDFGELAGSSISGEVLDEIGNPIDGVTLTLTGTDDLGNPVSLTTTTDAAGQYGFPGLRPGTYEVVETQPVGYGDGGGNTISGITLVPNGVRDDVDFVETLGSLTALVYQDDSNDGVQDGGEAGIGGVSIRLTGTDDRGNPVDITAATAADGSVTFDDLISGAYTLTETQPAGFVDGLDAAPGGGTPNGSAGNDVISGIVVAGGQDVATAFFGELPGASIAGTVLDEAGNPIPGVTITVTGTDDLGNPVTTTATTAADGTYLIDGLRPGSYTVTESQPAGYGDGGTNTIPVTLAPGDAETGVDFLELLGSIAGSVFNDLNANGVRDPGEPGIAGTSVALDGTDANGATVALSATTDANGDYLFDDLVGGDYTLTETQPTGFADGQDNANGHGTAPQDDTVTGINLAGGADLAGITFGEVNEASISGSVVIDDNNDGVADAGETGIAGVTLTLTGTDDLGAAVGPITTTTDGTGDYTFAGLRPGTYTIVETQDPAFFDGAETVGSAGGSLSANDTISAIVLGSGATGTNYDFGELPGAAVSGTVTADNGDTIGGVTLTLIGTDDLGNPVSVTTTTAPDGTYTFGPLRPGDYTVTESQPTGYGDGGNNVISFTLVPGESRTGVDFLETLGSLSGSVYEDLNANGVRDAGEPGIAGIAVDLNGTDDLGATITTTATTAADGTYLFDELLSGSYTVTAAQSPAHIDGQEASPAGTIGNDVVSNIPLSGGQDIADITFGEVLAAQIRGSVVQDPNNNGVAEPGEPGIPGVTLTLTGVDDLGAAVSATTTTNSAGLYVFAGLRPGTYDVTETQPAGFPDGQETAGSTGGSTATNDVIAGIPLASGDNSVDNDFGELPVATINGAVLDEIGNPIDGVTLTLTGTDDLGNPVSATTTTAADGTYSFSGLRPGDYTVTESQPVGYGDGGNNALAVTLTPGEVENDVDFVETLGSLAAAVYEDLDADGIRDGGEPPIAGVEITLTGTDDLGNAVSLTATTAPDGSVLFDELISGSYTLTETQPAAFIDGTDAAPGGGTPNGTAGNDVITGIVVGGGEDIAEATFGEVLGASISGVVYEDDNNDGDLDPGEGPISGVVLTLTGTDDLGNSVTASTTTDGAGAYDFPGLRPGTYTVTETQPAGYLDGTGDVLGGIVVGSGVVSSDNNFGELLPATIDGTVIDEAGDPIGGVTITVTGTDDLGNPVSLTTTTAPDGTYSFTDLRPGDYTVVESQPVGYGDGGNNSITVTLNPGATETVDYLETLGSIAGVVFEDTDGSGSQNGAETGIGGVTVTLTDGGGATTTTTTAADGSYLFDDLLGGSYTVTETQPTGFLDGADQIGTGGGTNSTNDEISGAVIPDGGDITGYDFGELPASTISGAVEDELGNPIGGVTITLTGTDDLGAPVSVTTTTLADGTYTFGPLRPGDYTVTESQPAGYGDGGNNVIAGITLAPDTNVTDVDFVETLGSIAGEVFEDLNANGVRDGGEPGIAGVTVTLSGNDVNGTPVSVTTTTDGSGDYLFDNLIGGTYQIAESQPAGFADGADTPGTSGGTSNGTDTITGIALAGGDDATDYRFGEVQAASLQGSVVVDLDNDGEADPGETGIAGITVTLTGTDDLGAPVSATTTTDGAGDYRFDGLRPGTYTVVADQSPAFFDGAETAGTEGGTVSANDTISGIVLGSGSAGEDYDFGELPAAAVNGTVLDETGAPISNVTITLTGTDDNGNPVSVTVTTIGDGSYSIPGLRPGTYTVTETQPVGYGDGPPNSFGITLDPGETETVDFVDNLGSISGSVIEDANNNGTREGADIGLAGVVVQLTGTDARGGSVSLTTTTDANGDYQFDDLIGGSYTLTELTEPAGYFDGADSGPLGTPGTNVNGRDEIASITLGDGNDETDFVFGEVLAGTIEAAVFVDDDNDGSFDAGEAGISGVTVTLTGTDDRGAAVSASGTTDANGDVSFGGLRPGTYVLTETQPPAFGDGIDASADPGANTATNDVISNLVLGSGETNANNTFGEIPPAGISGMVEDTAGRPIAGVTITVTGTDDLGNPISATTTTAPDGTYSFTGLRPGDYTVTESQPAGYGDGGSNVISGITLTPGSSSLNNDFVETLGSIAGVVFEDTNNNGSQEGSEPGIGGASIFLTGTDAQGAAVSTSVVTAADGSWTVDDLVGGTYTINEAQPAGFIDGLDAVGTAGGTLGNDVISGINLGPAEDATGYTFGEIDVASVSGSVLDDLGRPISGVTLTLSGTDDTGATVTAVVTTGLDGVYSFNGLRPGTYTVIETQPTGYGDGPESVGSTGGVLSANDEISSITLAANEDAIDYNFVETTSSLSATVFVDDDNDGISDPGETGLGGIDVTISGTDDRGAAVSITTTTAADGTVTFDGLVSGTYSVTAAQTPAFLDGTDTAGTAGGTAGNDVISGVAVGTDVDATDYDFGEIPAGSICGVVTDENGGAIAGVTITLTGTDDRGNPVTITRTTAVDGSYCFDDLRPGTYTVTQTQPPQYGNGTPNDVPVTLDPGEDETVNFEETFGSITGVIFEDLDGDGVRDAGEPGIPGAPVALIGTDANGNPVSIPATSQLDGSFIFSDLIGGTYSIVETQPAGYVDGTDTAGTAGGTPVNPGDLINGITLPGGFDASDYTFGEVRLGSISGAVVEDVNNDGQADPTETGIPGVTVTLTGTDDLGNTIDETTTTAPDGSYTFDDLRPGAYAVNAAQDAAYLDGNETAGTAGGNTTADDPGVPNDTIDAISLESGEDATDYDFGELSGASISGTVTDENGDPIDGVSITITGTDDLGNPINITVVTGTDGTYAFTGLRPGDYTVTEAQPDGYGNGSPNVVPVTLPSGGTEVVDFLETLGSIAGVVFDDLNADGVRDAGEPGIGGVEVTLTGTDAQGNPVTSVQLTDATDGTYLFDGLVGGTYTVTETQPTAFLDGDDLPGTAGGDASVNDVISTIALGAAADETDYDFAELSPSSLSGTVRTGSGDLIEGVIVTLTGTDDRGNTINTTFTTGPDGTYLFEDLRPGLYAITEATPTGFGEGGETAGTLGGTAGGSAIVDIPVGPGEDGVDYDFVDTLASLSGLVYHDVDEDGTFNGTDAGIVGVEITLTGTDINGAPVSATTNTAGDGTFAFENLLEGDYTITETQPFGFSDSVDTAGSLGGSTATNDSIAGIAVPAGVDGTGYIFAENGNVISGQVYLDNDGDGIRDPEDTEFLSGVVIELIDAGGTVISTTVTDSNGGYLFSGISAGDYTVRETQPPQWGSSSPNEISVTVGTGGQSGLDFAEKPGSISGVIFSDAGNDGTSSGDTAIENLEVNLVDSTGTTIATTVSGSDGSYSFTGLEAGDYGLVIVPPAGQTFSPPETGDDDLIDSDYDRLTGTVFIELGPGEDEIRVDAGITPIFYDLTVGVSVPQQTYEIREEVPFTVVATNLSNAPTPENVQILIPLPAGVTLLSAAGDGWTITPSGTVLYASFTGVLQPDQAAPPITIRVSRPTVGSIDLPATVAFESGTLIETNRSNNDDDVSVQIVSRNSPIPVPSLPVTGVTTLLLVLVGGFMMASGRGLLFFAGKKRDEEEDEEETESTGG